MAKMIEVIVKTQFLDRYTGKIRKVGEKMKITYDRLAEIRRSGKYVEVVKPTATAEKK